MGCAYLAIPLNRFIRFFAESHGHDRISTLRKRDILVWQGTLDCLDATTPPFSKGTPVAFRHALIAHDLDWRSIERTVEIAATSGLIT